MIYGKMPVELSVHSGKVMRSKSESPQHTEEDLIRRVVEGDGESFTELVKPHREQLRRYAHQALKNSADTEDVLQEALLKAFIHMTSFRGQSTFSTWLVSILKNEVRQHWRRARRYVQFPESMPDQVDPTPLPNWIMEQQHQAEALKVYVSKLPKELHEAVALYQLAGIPYKQAAKQLQISSAAFKSRVFRARALLVRFSRTQGKPGFRRAQNAA